MKAKDFDQKFDDNHHDIVADLELPTKRRLNQEHRRVNVSTSLPGLSTPSTARPRASASLASRSSSFGW